MRKDQDHSERKAPIRREVTIAISPDSPIPMPTTPLIGYGTSDRGFSTKTDRRAVGTRRRRFTNVPSMRRHDLRASG